MAAGGRGTSFAGLKSLGTSDAGLPGARAETAQMEVEKNRGIARIEGVDEPVERILGGIWDAFFIGGPCRWSPLHPNWWVLLRIVRALLACNNSGDGEY